MEVSAGNSSTAYGSGAAGRNALPELGNEPAPLCSVAGAGIIRAEPAGGNRILPQRLVVRRGIFPAGELRQRFFSYGEGETRTHNAIDGLHGMINAGYDTESLRVESLVWLLRR
jgi:hypothetical protein